MSKETAYLRRLKKQGIKSIFRQKNTPGTHDKILKSVPTIRDKNSGKAQKKGNPVFRWNTTVSSPT
jgi:hypothetical protein